MSKFIRTAILTYLIATPRLFTVFARLGVGPFGWPCRSGYLACVPRQVARRTQPLISSYQHER